ncbi:MAG: sigma factor [Planctomycetota bacterium]
MSDAPSCPHARVLSEVPWLRAMARGATRDSHQADDAVQEALLAMLERRMRDGRAPRRWLARVVQNFLRQLWRSNAARMRREQVAARAEALPSAADEVSREEVRRHVVAGVLALPEP